MRKVISAMLTGFLILCFAATSRAATTEVDALIEKLVQKGILTKQEAIDLKGEIVQDAKTLREEGLKESLPKWVQDMKLKGDLRVRYQGEHRDSTNARHRGRVRFRLGLETSVNEKVKVAAGLATGSGDSRSTNQTFLNNNEKPDVRLDYAYAQYNPGDWLSLAGGIIPRPFWNPKDLIFDTDINFQGTGANFKKKFNDNWEVFFNTGFFILEEDLQDTIDPYMYAGQSGFTYKPTADIALKLAGAYYAFDNIKDNNRFAQHSANTNTYVPGTTRYAYDYDAYGSGAEFALSNPLGLSWIPQFALFGEYIKNPNADEHDEGFLAGAMIGDKKIAGPGQWQASYNYRRLERNAVLDIFPDSDFYGGATHVQGHETTLSYGLGKNVSVDFDYYHSAPIGGEEVDTREATAEDLVQADLNVRF